MSEFNERLWELTMEALRVQSEALQELIEEMRALRDAPRPVSLAFDGNGGPLIILWSDGELTYMSGIDWSQDAADLHAQVSNLSASRKTKEGLDKPPAMSIEEDGRTS